MMTLRLSSLFVLVSLALTGLAPASARETALPLPRFASIRAGEVNVRTGPGVSYPVEWVFVRRAMPIEITAEFDTWRRIRDWEGAEGWVHQSMLSGNRSFVVTGATRTLRRGADPGSAPVARLEPGVIGELVACRGSACKVRAGGYEGWLDRTMIWGVYENETVED